MARTVLRLAAGQAITLPVDDGIRLTLEPSAVDGTVTVTYSLVKGSDADAHGPFTTSVTTRTVVEVEGPFYRVSVAGGYTDIFVT